MSSKSFLQTQEWLEFQKSLGRKTFRFDDGKIRANIIEHDLPLTKRGYLYLPHGPEIFVENIQGGLKNEVAGFVRYLKDLAKENKSIFVKIEPATDTVVELLFNSVNLKKSNKKIQPSRSIVIDLSLSEEDLLNRMHHKTRYNIKIAQKNGVVVEDSDDFDAFWKLLGKTTKRDRFGSHPKEYYKKLLSHFNSENIKADLIMAYHQGKAVAGAIMMTCGDTCYYLHGASDYDARSLMAPYALHWENMRYLKQRGIKKYDLWGVDAKKWPGVTRFKLGFGGQMIEYPGSFDLPISKFGYLLYKIARKIF